MGSLLHEIGRIPAILYEIRESTSLDENFVSTWHPVLGLALLRKYELPEYLEEILLHKHFSFLHRSLSPLAVIDLADLVVRQSFSKYGKLIFESPLPDATIDSTLGSNILDQFSSIGYRNYVEVRLPPNRDRRPVTREELPLFTLPLLPPCHAVTSYRFLRRSQACGPRRGCCGG